MEKLSPIKRSSWNGKMARHLLNRAGFGIPPDMVERLEKSGPAGAVDALISYGRYEDNLVAPDWLTDVPDYSELRGMFRNLSEKERQARFRELRCEERQRVERLKAWWLDRMRRTTRPLQEKLTLFWHGHFATSAEEVRSSTFNYELNSIFRGNAAGNFKTLVTEVGRTPAMLQYLDNNRNRKGHPNENWARELMELFTMGIGNYTEKDVREAARAFSGYTFRSGQFFFNKRQHDYGNKTFLGKSGKFDGQEIIDIIFRQEATARFICRKLWEYFVYENPSEEIITDLAEGLRKNRYELKPLLERIFLSREFYSERAFGSQIKSPAQYMVTLLDQLNIEPKRPQMVLLAMRALGQDLFYPPNVKGWAGNRAWIDTNRLLIRYNIPSYVVLGRRPDLGRARRLDDMGREQNEKASDRFRDIRRRKSFKSPLDLDEFYGGYVGKMMTQVVDGLADRFIGRKIERDQRRTVIAAINPKADEWTRLTRESVSEESLSAGLHLILSMAEYQLV